jgi:inorganic pyrophosphatase
VVETLRGSRNKYEIEADTGLVWLDRRLPGTFAFPADYGYVPGTLRSDEAKNSLVPDFDHPHTPPSLVCTVSG